MQTKIQLISNVLRIRKYAMIGIISGIGLGIIYYFLTMSMLPTHFDDGHCSGNVGDEGLILCVQGAQVLHGNGGLDVAAAHFDAFHRGLRRKI